MDYLNNKGERIGSLDVAISNDKSVTINRFNDVTTVTVRDRDGLWRLLRRASQFTKNVYSVSDFSDAVANGAKDTCVFDSRGEMQ